MLNYDLWSKLDLHAYPASRPNLHGAYGLSDGSKPLQANRVREDPYAP
ncbi:hypothetical protein [Bacillus sp. 3255]|nr:hypothetical protein [Bacillus sp. 3255]